MLFSSMIFLWAFLPTVLILYWMAPSIRLKNIVLLVASLIFYAWGEPIYIFLMLFVVLINYVTALLSVRFGRVALIIGVTGNLMILGYFKYFTFLIGIVNSILRAEKIEPKEIRFVSPIRGKSPNLVLIKAVKNGKKFLKIEEIDIL